MFSGKSEELIRRLRRAQIARQRVQIFKPAVDTRYADDHIVSHSELRIPSEQARDSARSAGQGASPTPRWSGSTKDSSSTPSCRRSARELAARGVRVIVAGLDQDYLGKPFEPMPQLLAVAEYITKTRAICMVCGNPANHTQRLVPEHRPRAARRHGHLRSALPPLLRSDAGQPPRAGARPAAEAAHDAWSTLLRADPAGARRRVPDRQRPRRRSSSCAGCAAPHGARSSGRRASRRIYGLSLGIGVMLGLLILLKAYLALRGDRHAVGDWSRSFGTQRVRRADDVRLLRLHAAAVDAHHPRALRGRHLDRHRLHALRPDWRHHLAREGSQPTLVVISRVKSVARRLEVPAAVPRRGAPPAAGQDHAATPSKWTSGPGLHLGARDARDSV